jgi:hypothetical protein
VDRLPPALFQAPGDEAAVAALREALGAQNDAAATGGQPFQASDPLEIGKGLGIRLEASGPVPA